MLLPVLGLFALGLLISLPVAAVLVRVGARVGALDTEGVSGHRKDGLRPVPNIGGMAIFVAMGVPLMVALVLLRVVDEATWARWLPGVAAHLDRVVTGVDGATSSWSTAAALLAGMAVVHVTGLIDDRRGLGPLVKLLVQGAVAAVLAIWFDVRLLEMLGDGPSVIVTVVWIVMITNAINFMDNMDGLAGGVAMIIAALLMCATLVNEQWFIAGMLALLAGSVGGFLVLNFPPAKIFMGDGGSLLIGFVLGVLTARTTYFDPSQADYALGTAWYGVFMPVVAFAIPLYDLWSVTLIRIAQGRSPFVGDQQHFSHRLVERGLSPRGAVAVIWGATAVTGIGGVSMGRLEPWQAILVGVQTLLVLMVIALLEHASRRSADADRTGGWRQ